MTAVDINKTARELETTDRQKLLLILQYWIRDLLVYKSTGDADRLYCRSYLADIRRICEAASPEALNRMLLSWETLKERMMAKVKTDAACEVFLLQIRRLAANK